jgi:glycerol-3-phosphate acyltransferase PlsY
MRWGLVVAILDVAKSTIPLFVAQHILTNPLYIAAVAIAPVAGHIYSPWLTFRGGKGAGATLGMLLALLGPARFVILLGVWIASLVIFRLMSATNLVLALLVPFIFWFIFRTPATIGVGLVLTLMMWFAHRENIDRLMHGKENILTFKF